MATVGVKGLKSEFLKMYFQFDIGLPVVMPALCNITHYITCSLCSCVDTDELVLDSLSAAALKRMANNLIEVLAAGIEAGDYGAEMTIPSVTPWLLLFSVIRLYVIC